MSAPVQLPWPAEWGPLRRPKWWVLFGFLLFLAIAMPTIGAVALASGDVAGVFILMFSPVLPLVMLMGYLTRLRGRDRGVSTIKHTASDPHRVGVVIPYSAAIGLSYLALTVTMVLLFGALTALGLWVELGGAGADIGGLLLTAAFGAMALYMLAFVIDVIRGKLALGAVTLSPHGVYHRSWAFDSFFSWDGALFVSAADTDGPLVELAVADDESSWLRRTSRLWKQEELMFAPHCAVRGMWLSVDPALLYHALCYYQRHPEARAELGDERGLRRLRTGDLPAD